MGYKFKGSAEDYFKALTPEMLKEAFESYGFTVELNEFEEEGNEPRVLEGEVSINEIDCSGWYSTYGDVTNPYESLTEVLEEYQGKKVRVTIEVIDQ